MDKPEMTIKNFKKLLYPLAIYGGGIIVTMDDDDIFTFNLYTDNHVYHIKARNKTKAYRKTYLGCIMNNRKTRVGEHWTRGRDLPDGQLSLDTWNDILEQIVATELVKAVDTTIPSVDVNFQDIREIIGE